MVKHGQNICLDSFSLWKSFAVILYKYNEWMLVKGDFSVVRSLTTVMFTGSVSSAFNLTNLAYLKNILYSILRFVLFLKCQWPFDTVSCSFSFRPPPKEKGFVEALYRTAAWNMHRPVYIRLFFLEKVIV